MRISSPDSPSSIEVDEESGMPRALTIVDGVGQITRNVTCSIGVDVGGTEHRHPTGGWLYRDTETFFQTHVVSQSRRVHKGLFDEHTLEASLGPLSLTFQYRLFSTAPYFEFAVTFAAANSLKIRNVRFDLNYEVEPDAKFNAPGNLVRRNLPLSAFGDSGLGISTLGNLRGSSAIIGVSDRDATLTVWPNHLTEIPYVTVSKSRSGLTFSSELNFAAEISKGSSAELLLMTLNLARGDFGRVREEWGAWASRYGLTSPNNPPSWMFGANIYEVQIGTSYFWKNNSYCRYPEIQNLIQDLDRVQELGFNVIQLMPRQPYPSYNVHDYANVTVSYGEESELRELVQLCHSRGMRVILDVLLHGVLDQESIAAAVEGVVEGPIFSRLDEEIFDTFAHDVNDEDERSIHWSRHILDFSEYWKAGSPKRTPLQLSNPDWFATDSSGSVGGVYTKAFDARNPRWQEYFRQSMMNLIRDYDVDGFRFDAPTYNMFANWAEWAKARAFMSPLGCVPLFVDMRHDMKREKPDALLYTEPSGLLLRRSMDVNYNYDEQWLISALMTGNAAKRAVRDGKDFMRWIEDRDEFLPMGSHTAHHIDSHDTFWWPQWGKKWRREQYSIAATEALAAIFLSLDGPYMMFTGGEDGIEQKLAEILNFRNSYRDAWKVRGQFDTESDDSGKLIIVRRNYHSKSILCVINSSPNTSADIPREYRELQHHITNRVNAQRIEPLGYFFAVGAQ